MRLASAHAVARVSERDRVHAPRVVASRLQEMLKKIYGLPTYGRTING